MKILLILGMMLSVFMLTVGAEKFSFQEYDPKSPSVVRVRDSISKLNGNSIDFPRISAKNPKATKSIQKSMDKFVKKMTGDKNGKYYVTYDITTNNSKLVSILFTVERTDRKDRTVENYYSALTFDAVTGKELKIGDLLVSGYEKSLGTVFGDKVVQLSVPVNSSFDGPAKKQEFYVQNSGIVFFFEPYRYTDFADGQVFLPFELADLRGLLR